MKTLIAEISIDNVRNTMGIYQEIINGKENYIVQNYKGTIVQPTCESFDQAVKFACEYLGLVYYKINPLTNQTYVEKKNVTQMI
jgi:hypothetical protein